MKMLKESHLPACPICDKALTGADVSNLVRCIRRRLAFVLESSDIKHEPEISLFIPECRGRIHPLIK